MNEHYDNYDMDEMEIDLIDFLFYLLRRWKSLVAMILLGAILGSAFYVVKTTKSSNAAIEDYQPDADTEANMKLAAQYRKLYDQQMDYNEHSIVMQMDPNQVYEGTLTYYLAAGEQTELLEQLYTNVINDENVVAELKEAVGLTCDDQYVKELISSSVLQKDIDENNNLSGTAADNNFQITIPTESASNTVITYHVAYLDKETCEKMTEVLQNAIESATQEYQTMYGSYTWNELQTTVAATVDQKYLWQQRTSATLVDNYLTKLTKLEDAFSDTEMTYYQTVYLEAEQEAEGVQTSDPQNGISVKDLIKWLVVGIFGFAVLWGACYFFKYLLDPSIKTLDEVKNMNISIIGHVENETEHPNLIERLEQKKNGPSDIVEYLAAVIEALPGEKILLCVDPAVEEEKQLGTALEQMAGKLHVIASVHGDADALEQAKHADGVILCVRSGKTSRKELIRELEVCRMQKIDVWGVVGITSR